MDREVLVMTRFEQRRKVGVPPPQLTSSAPSRLLPDVDDKKNGQKAEDVKASGPGANEKAMQGKPAARAKMFQSSEPPAEKTSDVKPPKIKREGSNLFKAFAKSRSKIERENTDSSVAASVRHPHFLGVNGLPVDCPF